MYDSNNLMSTLFFNFYKKKFTCSKLLKLNSKKSMRASSVLNKGQGYCVAKAVLLAALARSRTIPARLGFADVKNHLTTERLTRLLRTDIYVYHGYTELFLNNKWVKATPAFNLTLCNNFNVKPLEFDGKKIPYSIPLINQGTSIWNM